jgi:mannose/fructose-specific phosphotransferase system component IIA
MPTLADILGGNTLSGLLGTGAQVALANYGLNEARAAGRDVQTNLGNIANTVQSQLQFKPYTVTTGTGTTNVTGTGATSTLSPELQGLVSQLTGSATGMFGQAGQPIDARALETTAALEAAAAPSRERERLALEERLLGQGRLGVRTSMFGGTPEQLALNKAIEEQRLNNVLTGRNQALTEQMQAYTLGAGMLGQSFLPGQMQIQELGGATPFADIQRLLQQQSTTTGTNLQLAGAEARMQSEQQANALRQIYLQQALQGLLNPTYNVVNGEVQSGNSILQGLLGGIAGIFR